MRSHLKFGAVSSQKSILSNYLNRLQATKVKRVARLLAAAALVVGVGAASAFGVNLLVHWTAADAPKTETTAAAAVPRRPADRTSPPIESFRAEIERGIHNPAAIAKAAAKVGPEHAIELPTDDPTEEPILQVDKIQVEQQPVKNAEHDGQPAGLEEDAFDATLTAALPSTAGPKTLSKFEGTTVDGGATSQVKPAKEQGEIAFLSQPKNRARAGRPSEEQNAESVASNRSKSAVNATVKHGRAAHVLEAVNMRSGPNNDSSVLTVVPAGSAVEVLSCSGWCRISYDDRTGWVYKTFLAGGKS